MTRRPQRDNTELCAQQTSSGGEIFERGTGAYPILLIMLVQLVSLHMKANWDRFVLASLGFLVHSSTLFPDMASHEPLSC